MPSFILREAGLKVNDVAKIHVPEPKKSDYAIVIDDLEVTIPLQLNGFFRIFIPGNPHQMKLNIANHYP